MLLMDADGEPIGEVLKQIRRWERFAELIDLYLIQVFQD